MLKTNFKKKTRLPYKRERASTPTKAPNSGVLNWVLGTWEAKGGGQANNLPAVVKRCMWVLH